MPTASPNTPSSQSSSQHSFSTSGGGGGGGGGGSSGGGGGGGGGEQLSKTNLYIRGLKPDTSDKDLVQLCQQSVNSVKSLVVLSSLIYTSD